MNTTKEIGAKFNKDLDVADVAKLIRKDLKAAFPAAKFSVRIERYSMGQRINVYAPSGVRRAKVKSICNAYTFAETDSMTDYCRVNFFLDISYAD